MSDWPGAFLKETTGQSRKAPAQADSDQSKDTTTPASSTDHPQK
jgi:hypothetical protein